MTCKIYCECEVFSDQCHKQITTNHWDSATTNDGLKEKKSHFPVVMEKVPASEPFMEEVPLLAASQRAVHGERTHPHRTSELSMLKNIHIGSRLFDLTLRDHQPAALSGSGLPARTASEPFVEKVPYVVAPSKPFIEKVPLVAAHQRAASDPFSEKVPLVADCQRANSEPCMEKIPLVAACQQSVHGEITSGSGPPASSQLAVHIESTFGSGLLPGRSWRKNLW